MTCGNLSWKMMTEKDWSNAKWWGCGLVFLLISFLPYFLPVGKYVENYVHWIESFGWIGVILFSAAYVLGTVLFVPGSLLTIGAGIAFGIIGGTVVALLSATLGATLAFLIARYLARSAIEKKIKQSEKLRAIDAAIESNSIKVISLLRLSPIVPFNLSNYVFGVTKSSLSGFVIASLFGMLPGAFLYAYLGHIGAAALGGSRSYTTPELFFLVFGLIMTIAVSVYLTHLAKKELARARTDTTA
jgi:uncharacterized membrane protein YdjX (TVP38/TMEM64 family)